ncbi:MAG: ABC transporter substrate-binding protein [Bdellovibrionales bacterium]|nr:ABC transporter substrate-binding protein [Bdellovibrionales bacterium]
MKMLKLFIFCCLLIINSVAFAEDIQRIKIGCAFSLTGVGSAWGNGELNALKLIVEDVNSTKGIDGKKLELICEDTKSSNLGSVSAIKKLVTIDKVDYLIGPTWLDSFRGVLPILDQAKIFTISASAVPSIYKKNIDQYPYVFSTWYNHENEVKTLLQDMLERKFKKIALLFDQDPYFQATADLIQNLAPKLNLEVVKRIDTSIGDSNFTPKLLQLKSINPDLIIIGFIDESAGLAFLKRRSEILPEKTFYGFHDIDAYIDQEMYKGLLSGIYYVRPVAPKEDFLNRYQAVYGSVPILSTSNSYDAGRVLVEALKAGKRNPDEIANYFKSNQFDTVTFGKTTFDEFGAVTGGEFEIVKIP